MPTTVAELAPIESYYDTVPRASATVERVGPFTLFVSTAAFPFYARPATGADGGIRADDVAAVRARQRELGVPEAFEWVEELRPGLADVLRAAGLAVYRLPLMVHDGGAAPAAPPDVEIRVLTPDDRELAAVQTAIGLGFGAPGTAVGPVGDRERLATPDPGPEVHEGTRNRLARGDVVIAGAFGPRGAVGGGSHSPRADVTEITGVATLPAYRRRGVGAAVTGALTDDAYRRGVATCFLSAGSAVIGRIYARAGFRRVGTACVAGAPV